MARPAFTTADPNLKNPRPGKSGWSSSASTGRRRREKGGKERGETGGKRGRVRGKKMDKGKLLLSNTYMYTLNKSMCLSLHSNVKLCPGFVGGENNL